MSELNGESGVNLCSKSHSKKRNGWRKNGSYIAIYLLLLCVCVGGGVNTLKVGIIWRCLGIEHEYRRALQDRR